MTLVFYAVVGGQVGKEIMTGKQYMDQLRKIRREIRLLEEQILRDTVLASHVKAIRYDIDRVQTSPSGDQMTNIVSSIVAETEKLYAQIKKLQEKENEARSYLILLPEELERVLSLHYLDGKRWDEIAILMNYADKYIYEVRSKALDELTKVLTKSD